MSAVDITAIAGVVVAVCAGIIVPIILYRRKQQADSDLATVVSWKGMTERLDSERDSLQRRLDESEERHRKEIQEMESDWDRRAAAMQKRITELQAEVDALGRQLATALRRGGGTV